MTTYNGLDPEIWGDLAHWRIAQGAEPPTEIEAALDLLGRAQSLCTAISDGANVTPDAAAFLHDDIASAATHYGWWMMDEA